MIRWSIHECVDISDQSDFSEWELEAMIEQPSLADYLPEELAMINQREFRLVLEDFVDDYTMHEAYVQLGPDGLFLPERFSNGAVIPAKYHEELAMLRA